MILNWSVVAMASNNVQPATPRENADEVIKLDQEDLKSEQKNVINSCVRRKMSATNTFKHIVEIYGDVALSRAQGPV